MAWRWGKRSESAYPPPPAAARLSASTIRALGSRFAWGPPLLIGLLAAGLRLWAIDLAPFAYDEVDALGRARAVVGGELTSTGPLTSWGIPDPPVSIYLLVPPSALPRPAVAAAAWIAVLNVAAVVLSYLMARRFLGPRVALAAGLLYAVNPWAVYFSRRTWAEIVPLFTVVALWAAFAVLCCRRRRGAVPFFLALALQVQTRILALIYAPAALLTVGLFPRRWGLRWPLVGISLGALVSLPYLVYIGTHWSELLARLAEGNRGVGLPASSTNAGPGAGALLLWTAAGYRLLPATSRAAPWLDPLGQAGIVLVWVTGALLAAGLAMAAWAMVRRRPGWEALVVPAVWLVLPLGMLVVQSSSVYLHYLVALFPAVFLVMALPLAALLGRGRLAALFATGLLLVVCTVQVVTTGLLYRILETYDPDALGSTSLELRQAAATLPREAADQLGTGERYGVEIPLRFWQALADRAGAEAAEAGLDEILVLAEATDPLTAERPAILDYLLRPRLRSYFLATDALVFPMRRPSLVLEAPDVDPAESIERFGARVAAFPIPGTNRAGRDFARLTLIPARSDDGWAILPPRRVRVGLSGGVRLLGFRAETTALPGEALPVVTFWQLAPDAPEALPRVTVRLVGPADRTFESEPTTGPSPPSWRGERALIRRQLIAIPARSAGEYQLIASLSDANGTPLHRLDDGAAGVTLTTVRVTGR